MNSEANSQLKGWISVRDKLPPMGEEVLVLRPDDKIRTAYLSAGAMWVYTDCTHPLQNAFLDLGGTHWRND